MAAGITGSLPPTRRPSPGLGAAAASSPCACGCSTTRYCWGHAHALEREKLALAGDEQAAALCLSGGGIRSAALCLGVLQSLARHRLLREFHYLSTVSGGGFIGGWLTRCLHAMRDGNDPIEMADIHDLERALADDAGRPFPPLDNLRRYTNYLTPEPGLASADTWAGILLWLRNTAVNWAVFTPTMVGVASLPVIGLAAFAWLLEGGDAADWTMWCLAALGLLGLAASLFASFIALPSHSRPDPGSTNEADLIWTARAIHRWIAAPTAAWCVIMPLLAAPSLWSPARHDQMLAVFVPEPAKPIGHPAGKARKPPPRHGMRADHLRDADRIRDTAAALSLLAWLAAALAYEAAMIKVVHLVRYQVASNEAAHAKAFRRDRGIWWLASLASSTLLFAAIRAATGIDALTFFIVAPLWVAGTELARWTCFLALRRSALRGELDREWLARLNGTTLVVVASASAVATAALVLPLFLAPAAAFGSGLAAGVLAALAGKSAGMPVDPAKVIGFYKAHTRTAVSLTALAFAALLLAFFGGQVAHLAGAAATRGGSRATASYSAAFGTAAAVGGLAASLAFALGYCVDLGSFSMHAVYRNRLTRAFLGTARQKGDRNGKALRCADPYTGFDADDDVRVGETSAPRLFPVINVALNVTRMSDSARAERMAVPFTITPTSCGSAALRVPRTGARAPATAPGAYVETRRFDGRERETGPDDPAEGITLGRALAISGAAVSPNMGYHSSPLVAFAMTLFNVRLGAWLPNPGCALSWDGGALDGSRANETWTLLQELLGNAREDSKFVYLSDGGHFDNLGLYEMLRRQCRFIIVVDAARDEAYGFQDLGSTLRRALIDMNATVDFAKTIDVGNKAAPMRGGFAKVTYGDGPRRSGFILYLKSWMPETAPIEVRAFAAQKRNFPHDSTGNQFFAESDFESYRRLGQYLADEIIRAVAGGVSDLSLAQLFDLLNKAPAAP